MDKSFALGETLFNKDECFPNISKPICRLAAGEKSFEATTPLNIEAYEISTTGHDNIEHEYLYLAAAELSAQINLSMFTPIIENISLYCTKDKTYTTNGRIFTSEKNISNFNSNTKLEETTNCSTTKKIQFIFFNDKSDLSKGVLEKTNSGIGATNNFNPTINLYRGTTPNLPEYKDINTPEIKLFYIYHQNAWKTHYLSVDLAQELRKKLKISKINQWKVIDAAKQNIEQQEADILNRRKIID